ncbi:MurR/RpiR family transcriptional regulator [Enterococcus sp. DIV0756]|uniref:MurR/RpiR family transcriptional regulator n=1 Tax=Enterococcus sp. DIV0756 TaxID=2774636 RepID=UPI003F28E53E
MNILRFLEEKDGFNSSEEHIADYILKNKEDVLHMSIQELSTNTYSSTSAIVRLCRKIGTSGYKDFKIELSAELQKSYEEISDVNPDQPFTSEDSQKEIAKKIGQLMSDTIYQTGELLTTEVLKKAVEIIKSGKKIAIFAIGENYSKALNLQNMLMRMGEFVYLTPLVVENPQLAYNLDHEDCAIIISYSGEHKDILYCTKLLYRNRVKIVSICGHPDSTLARMSSVVLPLMKEESQHIKYSTFSSQVAIEYVINVLYSCLFKEDYDTYQERRSDTNTLFKDRRFTDKK